MNLVELKSMMSKIDEILPKSAQFPILKRRMQMLEHDIRLHYQDQFGNLSRVYRNAWDQVILNRLDSFPTPPPEAMKKPFLELRHSWNACTSRLAIKILFGQMRVGAVFQESMNLVQTQILGFPKDIVGRPLQVVRGMLGDGSLLSDQMPLHIFLSPKGEWVAANNRCYTAHCLAGVRPLRVIPRIAEQAEINRLTEVREGRDFNFDAGARLNKTPRTLPSDQMPITDGPNTWNVIAVATVPGDWQ